MPGPDKTLVSLEAAREDILRHAPERLPAFEAAIVEGRKIEAVRLWRGCLSSANTQAHGDTTES